MSTLAPIIIRSFNSLDTINSGVAADFTQITLSLPENNKVFRSVLCELSWDDGNTSASNSTQRRLDLKLGAGTMTEIGDSLTTLAQTGESMFHVFTFDATAFFNANWSGSSMTLDAQTTISDSAGGNPKNVSLILYIQYEHDETSATQTKSILWSFDSLASSLPTSKISFGTIPDIEATFLEDGLVIDEVSFILEGVTGQAAATTDVTLSLEIDSLGVINSQIFEGNLRTGRAVRWIANNPSFTTNESHTLNVWTDVGTRFPYLAVKMLVTYRYTVATTTTVTNFVMLPIEVEGGVGYSTDSFKSSVSRDLWIQEPGTITALNTGAQLFWIRNSNQSFDPSVQINGGGYTTYDIVASGSADSGLHTAIKEFTSVAGLARGKNTFSLDMYINGPRLSGNVSGVMYIVYSSGKSSQGINSHNKTALHIVEAHNEREDSITHSFGPNSISIPETNVFLNAIGYIMIYLTDGSGNNAGVSILVQRLAAENGPGWENAYTDICYDTFETGWRQVNALTKYCFKRWTGDPDPDRFDVQTDRITRVAFASAARNFTSVVKFVTYHSITSTVADSVSGFTGTVTISLHRAATGEKVLETTRTGDGAFSFTWYDNTEQLYVVATDGTNVGRSQAALAVIDT